MRRPLPPSRFRRIAKWAGLVVCVVVLALWGISVQWRQIGCGTQDWHISIAGGFIHCEVIGQVSYRVSTGWSFRQAFDPTPFFPQDSTIGRVARRWGLRAPILFRRKPNGGCVVFLPLWLPFLAIAAPTMVLWHRDRRPKPGCCRQCGYDLRASKKTCPECGTSVSDARRGC